MRSATLLLVFAAAALFGCGPDKRTTPAEEPRPKPAAEVDSDAGAAHATPNQRVYNALAYRLMRDGVPDETWSDARLAETEAQLYQLNALNTYLRARAQDESQLAKLDYDAALSREIRAAIKKIRRERATAPL